MKSNSFFVIQGWMINELNLKSNELLIFAIIYGFSKDGQGKFEGSLKYLSDATGCSRSTVIKTLQILVDKSLILKEIVIVNNISFCKYYQNELVVLNSYYPSVNLELGGSTKTVPNNITINNIENNKIDFQKLLAYYNLVLKKSCRVFPIEVKKSFETRIKEGYLKEDIQKVIDNASNDDLHKENNYKYVTLEFLARPKIFQRYASMEHKTPFVKKPQGHTNH